MYEYDCVGECVSKNACEVFGDCVGGCMLCVHECESEWMGMCVSVYVCVVHVRMCEYVSV